MANLQDRVADLEADNAALRRDIARLVRWCSLHCVLYNAPINATPHYPPLGQYQGTVGRFEAPGVGDLTNLDREILGDY